MGAIRTLEDLTIKGFDVELGMKLCGGEEQAYMEMLWAAMVEGNKKIPLIRNAYDQMDFGRYLTEVHGLKNAMKSIGAIYLSQLAAEQETAVKEENYAVVEVGGEEMLTEYQFVVDALKELLGE